MLHGAAGVGRGVAGRPARPQDTKKYGVFAAVGRRDVAYAGFTLADLKELKAGQVWVDSNGGHAMDRADFEKSAERSCH